MRMTLKQMLDSFDALATYYQRTGVDNNDKVLYLNWAQADIQSRILNHVSKSSTLFVARKTYPIDSSSFYAFPPNFGRIQYMEFSTDQTNWAPVIPLSVLDRDVAYEACTTGYVRMWFARDLSPLFQGSLESGTTITSAILPEVPTYSATGSVELADDAYVGATLVTSAGATSEITAYAASSRAATVSFSAGQIAEGTTVHLQCDLPNRMQRTLLFGALAQMMPGEAGLVQQYETALTRDLERLYRRQVQESVPWGKRLGESESIDGDIEFRSSYGYQLWGDQFSVVKVA